MCLNIDIIKKTILVIHDLLTDSLQLDILRIFQTVNITLRFPTRLPNFNSRFIRDV